MNLISKLEMAFMAVFVVFALMVIPWLISLGDIVAASQGLQSTTSAGGVARLALELKPLIYITAFIGIAIFIALVYLTQKEDKLEKQKMLDVPQSVI